MLDDFTNPILIFGDLYLCKNDIIKLKKKFPDIKWVNFSLDKDSLDSIRLEHGISEWDDSKKIILIQDLSIKKQLREFLLNICSFRMDSKRIIVWDSTNSIAIDPHTKTFNKSWQDFIEKFKKIKGSIIINNGEKLTHKDEDNCIEFVKKHFSKHNKLIDDKGAKLFIDMIGYDRGMLLSDIEKISLLPDEKITTNIILEHAFPSSKEAVLYKLSNVLDTESYEDSINTIERFLSSGIHPFVLADIMTKKARWQLAAIYFWKQGMPWNDITNRLMSMGKFPSFIWHNPNIIQKNRESDNYQDPNGMFKYMIYKYGIPKRYIKLNKDAKTPKEAGMGKSETIPFLFQAQQIVDFIKNKIILPNKNLEDYQNKILDKSIIIYKFILDKNIAVRYGDNQIQDLQEMVRALTNFKIV